MTGYKLFERIYGKPWSGPFYRLPKRWKIQAGSILTEKLELRDCECGPGVSFCKTLKDLDIVTYWKDDDPQDYGKTWIIYKVKTLPDSEVLDYTSKGSVLGFPDRKLFDFKCRTNKLKLVRVYENKNLKIKR